MRKLGLVLVLLITVLTCRPQPTPEQQIQSALETLLQLSPVDNAKLQAITVPITWRLGNLNGTTLAATTIYQDRVEIVFDWQEIVQKRERLEPIIAHELDHVHDAYIVFGVGQFFALVESERDLPWKDRTLEKSALKQEAETRKFLLSQYPEKFKGMLPVRKV